MTTSHTIPTLAAAVLGAAAALLAALQPTQLAALCNRRSWLRCNRRRWLRCNPRRLPRGRPRRRPARFSFAPRRSPPTSASATPSSPGDVNGDGRTDILAISGTDLVWFQAPTWEKHVILAGRRDHRRQRDDRRRTTSTATGGSTSRSAPAGPGRTPARCSGSGRTHPAPLRRGRCSRSPPSRRCTGSGGRMSTATGSWS